MNRRMGRKFFVVVILFSLLLLPIVGTLGSLASIHPETQGVQSHASGSNPSILRYAFFPREPRLEDVGPISGFAPIGIASYGPDGRPIETNSVRGETTFDGMSVGYFSGEEINYSTVTPYVGQSNATLQENAVLWLPSLGAYWTQNVVSIVENSPESYTLQMINNIWNFTTATANMNQQVTSGTGSVQCLNLSGRVSCFYVTVDPQTFAVIPPFTVKLTMTLEGGGAAASLILFQYQISDSSGKNYTGQYDAVKLYPFVLNVEPYFQIGGDSPVMVPLLGGTVLTLPSDLELTLGGPGGGSSVFINSISGSERLYYMNGTSYSPVPDAYSIGSDTGEEASGVTVTPDLRNPSAPLAILTSGFDTSEKLWPLPLSITLASKNDFQNGRLDINGIALYFGNFSSAASPAANISISDSEDPNSVTTNSNGVFGLSFRASSSGEFVDTISYGGSVAFDPTNVTLHIAVSSINISSSDGSPVVADFNSTQVLVQNQSEILIPLIEGSSLSVAFQNVSASASSSQTREFFAGYENTPSQPSSFISFGGNASQDVNANFVKQFLVTVDNPYTGQESSSWYNQSSSVQLDAPNKVSSSGATFSFENWYVTGGTNLSSENTSLPVEGPLLIIAQYSVSPMPSYTIVTEIIAAVVAVVVGFAAGFYVSRRSRPSV